MTVKRQQGAVQPGWRWGPFTARLPIYHARMEWVDLLQGLVVTAATSMALVPLLQGAFGLNFEEAIACSMIHLILISAAPLLFGDPFAPGWITPVFPIVIAFVLGNYTDPTERFSVMTALSLDFAALMLFFGITGLGQRFVNWLPKALKGGIILGASIAAFKRVFFDDIDTFMAQPVSTTLAIAVCLIFGFSKPLIRYRQRHRWLAILSNLGLLPGFLIAAVVGVAIGEVEFNIRWGVLIPPLGDLWAKASPFVIGWPTLDMLLSCLPLALIAYTIAFGDFITGREVIREASAERPDETIDVDVDRAHFSVGIRNILMAVLAPFFPTQGVLWTGVHVIVVQRWRQGRASMDSLFSGIGSFYLFGLPVFFFLLPVITALQPMMSIALSISLVMTGFACAYVAMVIPETPEERGVAMLTGLSLALMEPWVGLFVGVLATIMIVGDIRAKADTCRRDGAAI
ncbi:hypothetical protein HBA55_03395 [Pseudomaricurvus alkylphenolicus]|nr:hypothetical protein [Pseudomaricurvus alkylphenolicus]